jgi:hypothetical protein
MLLLCFLVSQALAKTVELQHKLSASLHNALKAFPDHVRQHILEFLKVAIGLCSSH